MSNRQERKKEKLKKRMLDQLLKQMRAEGVDFSFGPQYMNVLEQIDARQAELAQDPTQADINLARALATPFTGKGLMAITHSDPALKESWATKTADEIIGDINSALRHYGNARKTQP